jgi:endonuclease/exonuclease/phosphatase family metal-dependent hydrolase
MRRFAAHSFAALALFLSAFVAASAQTLTVVSWNVESGGSDDQVIKTRIASFQGVDLWGLSEVASPASAGAFELGAEDGEDANFERIVGTTGGGDRLAIIFNADRFRRVSSQELTDINEGNHRAPLVAELEEISSGRKFLFMVNHLARGNNALRHRQGRKLNEWVRTQTLPIVAVGDYNFDWEVVGGDQDHDLGYDNMTSGGAWTWVRPATLIKTQCSPNFDSVLDFVFVNSAAQGWAGTSQIVVQPNDCDPSPQTSDHRPVVGRFDMAGGGEGRPTKEQLLRRIEEIERMLNQLKETVRQMP